MMRVQCSFKTSQRSEGLKEYAITKIQHLAQKLAKEPIHCHFSFGVEGAFDAVSCNLFTGDGMSIRASHRGKNFVECIDELIEKVERQIERKKGKQKALRH